MPDRSVNADFESLKDDLLAIRKDLSRLGAHLVERGQDTAMSIKDRVQDSVETSVDSVQNQIREHPVSSVLIAFGAGLLLGKLVIGR